MLYDDIAIVGLAHVDAPIEIASAAIEDQLSETMSRLNIHPGLLEGLSGIRARRLWEEGFKPSDAATLAAKKALEASGIDKSDLGILINSSVCRDYIEPSTACIVHGNLQLDPRCLNFDMGNACLAFINAMDVVSGMIGQGRIKMGMIVDGESSRHVLNATLNRMKDPNLTDAEFRENFATLTLGSGSAAIILGSTRDFPDAPRYRGGAHLAATQHSQLCLGTEEKMKTDTKKLLIHGLELAGQTYAKASEALGWGPNTLDELVLHQVSKVHTDQLCNLLGLDTEKALKIYPTHGNVGPASVPIVLSKAVEAGRVQKGHRVGLLGIGSGLNCSMCEVAW
mgnify:FL=1